MAAGAYDSAAGRWQGVGPYYAMFPTHFADGVIAQHTSPGDIVLDPFAGRGTAVFSAAHQGRQGIVSGSGNRDRIVYVRAMDIFFISVFGFVRKAGSIVK